MPISPDSAAALALAAACPNRAGRTSAVYANVMSWSSTAQHTVDMAASFDLTPSNSDDMMCLHVAADKKNKNKIPLQ
jgi:hypothetical protein